MNPETMANKATEATLLQLDVTPKPGLVDRRSTGAHTDLSYDLLKRVAVALTPHWVTFGQTGLFLDKQSDQEVAAVMEKVGVAAIEDMLAITDGANAYKGTIFALGLFITSYYRLYRQNKPLTWVAIRDQIAALAQHITRKKDTHGDWVNESYGVKGALGEAQEGYGQWLKLLPLFREARAKGEEARFFLYVVAHLKDSCLYYRAGAELAENAATIADYVYQHYNQENVDAMCSYFERCHLSTGGAGDVLTLLYLADSVLE